MITISNGNKTIKISFGNTVRKLEICTRELVYTVTLPEVTCNNEADAKYIQEKTNQFVNTLIKELLENKE